MFGGHLRINRDPFLIFPTPLLFHFLTSLSLRASFARQRLAQPLCFSHSHGVNRFPTDRFKRRLLFCPMKDVLGYILDIWTRAPSLPNCSLRNTFIWLKQRRPLRICFRQKNLPQWALSDQCQSTCERGPPCLHISSWLHHSYFHHWGYLVYISSLPVQKRQLSWIGIGDRIEWLDVFIIFFLHHLGDVILINTVNG